MDRWTVSDGTDTATLSGDPERWLVELNVSDPTAPGEPSDELGTNDDRARRLLEAATQAVALQGGGRLEYWIERVDQRSDDVPTQAGFVPYRDLLRLRRELPALVTDLVVRPFKEADAEAFLECNNRAFDWHPEQGEMTSEDLTAKQAEPWYDPEGFLLLEEVDNEGKPTITGFCWTKVHAEEKPALGEIYAIAVDPGTHPDRPDPSGRPGVTPRHPLRGVRQPTGPEDVRSHGLREGVHQPGLPAHRPMTVIQQLLP